MTVERTLETLRALSERIMVRNRLIFWALIVINVASFFIGTVYWYGRQLGIVPPIFWLFVPDCPLTVLVFAIALWGVRAGKRWPLLNVIVGFAGIKYAIWVVVVWASFWRLGGPFTIESVTMTLTHIGMGAECVALLTLTRWERQHALLAAAFFFLSDFVDYGLGYHPYYPQIIPHWLIQNHSVVVTALLAVLFTALAAPRAAILLGSTPHPVAPLAGD